MSLIVSDEPKIEDIIKAARQQSTKCKIPLLSTLEKQKTDPMNYTETTVLPNSRPRSTNRTRDQSMVPGRTVQRIRPERERLMPALKRPSTIPKRIVNDSTHKNGRPVITVPVAQRHSAKSNSLRFNGLPTQNKIMKQEELEMQQIQMDGYNIYDDLNELESITSESDRITKLKSIWQEKMILFEKSKTELKDRQKGIMALYATMRNTHQKMKKLGQKVNLPSAENLHIMNVSKLSPEQLLQLCAGGEPKTIEYSKIENRVTVDVNKLINMPNKLVDKCEETIFKRKEIIDWFESLISQEKGISTKCLSMKVKEFNSENNALKASLDQLRADFLSETNYFIDCLRKSENEIMALQLRTKELSCALSDMSTQNTELRKQNNNGDHHRPYMNKNKMEELERLLKDEKYKKSMMKDRLSRAEGQLKTTTERVSQLEAALEQAHSESWALERTVQQQHDQNLKLQEDFDQELNKLTQSIKENTIHLEDIALAREKLQSEKEEVEKRLEELSASYNESIKDMKHERNVDVAKVIEIEKKYNDLIEEHKGLQDIINDLRADILESELRVKDLVKELDEKESILEKKICLQNQLESTKIYLENLKTEIEGYQNNVLEKDKAIEELKFELDAAREIKIKLGQKDEIIAELEGKLASLRDQLKQSESKMEGYFAELVTLKSELAQLREFGAFDTLNDFREKLNQQKDKLHNLTKQQEVQAEKLELKEKEVGRLVESMAEQEQQLNQREDILKMLTEKEEDQRNIINLLQNNLDMRNQAEMELHHQLVEKTAEIKALQNGIESRKQQILELEKIILAQEDQTRKSSARRKKDNEKINVLEKRIIELESHRFEKKLSGRETPENLDNLIKILEDELDAPFENDTEISPHLGIYSPQSQKFKRNTNRCNRQTLTDFTRDEPPINATMGNFMKKSYRSTTAEHFRGDPKVITKRGNSTENRPWVSPSNETNVCSTPTTINTTPLRGMMKENFPLNMHYITSRQLRDDKKNKMLKLTGHKL